jgi:hypothetical protein
MWSTSRQQDPFSSLFISISTTHPIFRLHVFMSHPDRIIAASDPLAAALFGVGHVMSVLVQDKFITATKDDDLSWFELLTKQ